MPSSSCKQRAQLKCTFAFSKKKNIVRSPLTSDCRDCAPLVSTIGLLFQILDDHLNLSPTSGYSSLKGICEDLTEGKFSFPVIHAIRADPSNQILINILKQKTSDEEVKKYALRYMESKGSFDYSARIIGELRGRSEEHIQRLEQQLGAEGREGAEALRKMLGRLVLR